MIPQPTETNRLKSIRQAGLGFDSDCNVSIHKDKQTENEIVMIWQTPTGNENNPSIMAVPFDL